MYVCAGQDWNYVGVAQSCCLSTEMNKNLVGKCLLFVVCILQLGIQLIFIVLSVVTLSSDQSGGYKCAHTAAGGG